MSEYGNFACRRTGIDAYILGLGASVGVMVWTGMKGVPSLSALSTCSIAGAYCLQRAVTVNSQ